MSAHELLRISSRNRRMTVDQIKNIIYAAATDAANRGDMITVINFDESGIHMDMRGYMEGLAKDVFPGITAFRTNALSNYVIGQGDRLVLDWTNPL